MTNVKLTIIIILLSLFVFASSAMAGIPQQLSYQGCLFDSYGDPVPDGNYDITFVIWDDPYEGSSLWSEALVVAVSDGRFSVILGDVNPIPALNMFDGSPLNLGVTVEADPEMTPRTPLTSSPYAFAANSMTSVTDMGWLTQAVDLLYSSANTVIAIHDAATLPGDLTVGMSDFTFTYVDDMENLLRLKLDDLDSLTGNLVEVLMDTAFTWVRNEIYEFDALLDSAVAHGDTDLLRSLDSLTVESGILNIATFTLVEVELIQPMLAAGKIRGSIIKEILGQIDEMLDRWWIPKWIKKIFKFIKDKLPIPGK